MNIHLDKAHDIAAQLDAILYAIDKTYMEDADSRLQYLHQTLRDLATQLTGELEALSGDQRIVSAIYAVNDVRRQKGA